MSQGSRDLRRVTVLGAGLTGLAAADLLTSEGVEVLVLEKEDHPGGLAATVKRGAFHFDLGPHRYHTTKPELLDLVRELLPDGLLLKERLSRIRLLDRYFQYPLALGDVLKRMPPHRGAAMMLSYFGERLRNLVVPRDEASFEGWVVRRFGRRLYDIYFGPYTEKLWGVPPSALSADWASQRITVPGLTGLIRETLFPSKEKVRSLVSTFHYPSGGIGRISEELAARIENRGGRVLYGTAPDSIARSASGGFTISVPGGPIDTDGIVSTIPVDEYVALLDGLVPEEAHRASEGLAFRAIVFVALKLNTRGSAGDHWIYAPEERYLFNRLSIPENFDPDVSDEGSQVVFEFSCGVDDDIWTGRTDIIRSAIEGGVRLGLFQEADVLESMVTRTSHAYPIYDLGYSARSAVVLDALDAIAGSVTCGRQGLFRYNNMDHSIEMGRCAALEHLGRGTVRESFSWTSDTWADG